MDSMNYYGNRFTTFGTRTVDSRTRAYGFDIDEDRRELLREFARKLEEGIDRYYENLLAGFDRAFEAVKEKYNSEKNFETIEEGSKGQPVVGDESSSEEKSVEADVVEEEEKQESERESMGIFEDLKMPSVSESSEMKRPTKAEAVKEEEKLEEPESELTRAYGSGGYELNLEYGDQGTNYGSEYGAGIPVLQLCKVGHSGGVNQIRARPHVIVSWADTGQVQFDAHEDERFAIDWGPPISGKLMSVSMSEEASSASVKACRSDPGWKYCTAVDDSGGTNKVRCNFCDKIMTAGITRGNEHLMGKRGKVAPCKKVPAAVKEELWKLFKEKTEGPSAENQTRGADIGFSDEDDEVPTIRGSSKPLKGPMDLFCRNPTSAKDKQKRQVNIREGIDKEVTARVHQSIARFWYQSGLSFNSVKLKSFQDMLEAVGAYGRHLKAPSYHAIRVPLLKKELELTKDMLKTNTEEWATDGCSIMSDGWTDRKQRTIINFLVNSPSGTVFVKSIDGSKYVKTGQKLFELLDSMIEEIGEEKVVQVVTDNGSNYVAAGKLLMDKRPHLYWTPCAAHCIDLMLEDIGKLPDIKKTIRRAVNLVGFIYNHTSTLSLLRRFTNKRELVRPAATRFATSFLSLQRIFQEKVNIRKMFTSEEWDTNKLSKEVKGREATKTVLMPSFWRSVVFTLKVMAPLVRVLRLVDGDMKPAMGYIYEAMDRAKETIEKSFDKNESKYRDIFSIIDNRWDCQLHRPLHAAAHFLNPEIYYDNRRHIDYDLEIMRGLYDCIDRLVVGTELRNQVTSELEIYKMKKDLFGRELAELQRKSVAPAQWWKMFGHSAPNLQRFAIRILGLTCSASGCERNWSVFEQIHSKKRNRLEHQKLNDLVYVKYNQKLRERHEKRSELDPISLDDIDDCNEWLVGAMDDDDGEGGDLVFDDDTLDWDTVFDATGAGEPSTFTRSNTKKRKEPTTSDSRGKKSKSLVDEDDENEEENHDEPSEAEEEEEGYASLDDDEVHGDDYAEVDLDD